LYEIVKRPKRDPDTRWLTVPKHHDV